MYDDAYSVFQIYDFKVCGSNLFQTISSNWLAALDLSSTCLSVPPFLFTRLTKWLPLECPSNKENLSNVDDWNAHNNTIPPYSSLCIVREVPLPTISFRLKQSGVYFIGDNGTSLDDGEYIYIHLNDYLINYDNKNYLCLLNSTLNLMGKNTYIPVNDDYLYSSYYTSSSKDPPILFGSLFLKSYGVVVDYAHNKIGFYPKFKYRDVRGGVYRSPDADSNCPARRKCVGDSIYDQSLNECIPPDCSEWFLYELDANTNKCIVNSASPFVIAAVVVVLVCFELHVMYLKQFILEKSNSIVNSAN